MTNQEILTIVKCGLKELSNYNDDEVMLWIKTAIGFLESSGVKPNIARSEKAIGVITLCVESLRLREDFSKATLMLVTQLTME